jgi:hypothetical protein
MKINMMFEIIDLCRNNYTDETYKHAGRVADYAVKNPMISSDDEKMFIYCVAMCHDLLEDTAVTKENISKVTQKFGQDLFLYGRSISDCVLELTHNKELETYNDYICKIKNNGNPISYIVKLADMKDHFMQTETLTEKLKEKYIDAIRYLL